jgi:hypothetical protein
VNGIDTSALKNLQAINRRLKHGRITLQLSVVKGPVMDRLKRSHLLEELTGLMSGNRKRGFVQLRMSSTLAIGNDQVFIEILKLRDRQVIRSHLKNAKCPDFCVRLE